MVASFKQIQPYIIQSESGGRNYTSQQNYDYPRSTASGYYQITNTTWGSIPTSITGGAGSASQASYAQQTAAAQYLWERNAGNDWIGINPNTGKPFNSVAYNANAAIVGGGTPSTQISSTVSNLVAGGDGGSGTPQVGTGPGQLDPYVIDPSTGQPYGAGTTPGVPNADPNSINPQTGNPISTPPPLANALPAIGAWVGNWAVRLGLIAVGIVLIGAAAASLAKEHDIMPPLPVE